MPKISNVRDRLVKARARAAVIESAAVPEFVVVRSRVVLHRRREQPGPRCPCCGSPWAYIVEETPGPQLLIDTGLEDGLKDPAMLQRIARAQQASVGLEVGNVRAGASLSLADVVHEIHQALNGGAPEMRTIPGDRRLVAQIDLVQREFTPDVVSRRAHLVDETESWAAGEETSTCGTPWPSASTQRPRSVTAGVSSMRTTSSSRLSRGVWWFV